MTKRMRRPGGAVPSAHLPANPFFATPEQRLALARQRYFEDGILPSAGIVDDVVLQSWARCRTAGHEPSRPPDFNRVTPRLVRATVQFNRPLIEAAENPVAHLQQALRDTGVAAVLTDARGVVVHAAFTRDPGRDALIPLAARVGIDLSEAAAGTSAPAVATQAARACLVRGAEHFFSSAGMMHCAAWPIQDARSRLAGVLSLFSEDKAFAFDALALVGMYATAVENRLLRAQSTEHFLVQMALSPMMLDTPAEGLVGMSEDGRILWMNHDAARLLGQPGWHEPGQHAAAGDAVKLDARALLTGAGRAEPVSIRLPNGLGVWVRSRPPQENRFASATAATRRLSPVPQAAPGPLAQASAFPARSLREADRQWIAQALQANGGNVSRAARQLGISRGRIYRHLRMDTSRQD